MTGGLVLSVLLLVAGIAAATSGDDGDERIGTDGGLFARAGVTTRVEQAPAVVEAATTTSSGVAPASAPTTAAPVAPTTTLRRPVPTTVRATTTTAVRQAAVAPSTTAPAPLAAAETSTTTTTAPVTTTTAVDPCRNSTDSKCGPFRFHPQPGADNPMTVEVAVEPATPVAGEPMMFHVTLTDPDGASYNGTTFNFGNGGIGGSTPGTCAKYGPWEPPARDPASATKTIDVGRTYFEPGTFTATFAFDAGPFDCTDSVTGRGDRPYASSATGTVTFTVVAS